jgi:ribosome-associated protein
MIEVKAAIACCSFSSYCIEPNDRPNSLKYTRFTTTARKPTMARDPEKDTIRLGQFLKYIAIAATGGQAKLMIQGGEVSVNGAIETRRGRQLHHGDVVSVGTQSFTVDLEAL